MYMIYNFVIYRRVDIMISSLCIHPRIQQRLFEAFARSPGCVWLFGRALKAFTKHLPASFMISLLSSFMTHKA